MGASDGPRAARTCKSSLSLAGQRVLAGITAEPYLWINRVLWRFRKDFTDNARRSSAAEIGPRTQTGPRARAEPGRAAGGRRALVWSARYPSARYTGVPYAHEVILGVVLLCEGVVARDISSNPLSCFSYPRHSFPAFLAFHNPSYHSFLISYSCLTILLSSLVL